MKIHLSLFILVFWGAASLSSMAEETRVKANRSAEVRAKPESAATVVGTVSSGDILFATELRSDWVAIQPPDQFDLWISRDLIEQNKVIAKTAQVRSGPGIQFDTVGNLQKHAPILKRGEEGDWLKIAAPSTCTLWITRSSVDPLGGGIKPSTPTAAEPATAKTESHVAEKTPPPAPTVKEEEVKSSSVTPPPSQPSPISTTKTSTISPARTNITRTSSANSSTSRLPPSTHTTVPPPPTVTAQQPPARPAPTPQPTAPVVAPSRPSQRVEEAPLFQQSIAPSSGSGEIVSFTAGVTSSLLQDFDLDSNQPQGNFIEVEGELRNAPPIAPNNPARYRLVQPNDRGRLEVICNLHGNPAQMRNLIGKKIHVQGREYWVEGVNSSIVIPDQIIRLSSADDE